MQKSKTTFLHEFSDDSGVALFNAESGAVIGVRHSINDLLLTSENVSESLLNDLIKQGFLEES
ncbi:hypothetical protein [uncultured Paraglaciecola sp.]|uniref:hypothetical protein n=1 Tax=uncultured Paraglaciecola sp. TaxID=1765024 RepID=UPI0030DD363F|tara:strand:+ start:10174 stop:10362 length:189 start_codon:yes stop_codon:yes gene_type:complete